MKRRIVTITILVSVLLSVVVPQTGHAEESNRNEVRADIDTDGWRVAWGDLVNEADYVKLIAAVAAASAGDVTALERFFSEQLEVQARKLSSKLPGLGAELALELIVDAIASNGVVQHKTLELDFGIATYKRWKWVTYDEPRTYKCKVSLPLGGWTWGTCTTTETVTKKVPLPNNHQPYIRSRWVSTVTLEVPGEGTTTVKVPVEPSGPPAPPGFLPSELAAYWDIAFEHKDGPKTLCISDFLSFGFDDPEGVRLFHWNNDEWIDITTTVDVTDDGRICGTVYTFSPFAVFEEQNYPPVAEAGGPYKAQEGSSVRLAGSATDRNQDPLTYAWNYDPDGAFDDASGATPSFHAVQGPASHTLTLKVTDDRDAHDTDSATLKVTNVPPTVSVGNNATIQEGESFTRNGSFTDPGADSWSATVDYGDGTGVTPLSLSGKGFSLSHVYADNGFYTVKVCVDDGTETGCSSFTLTVQNEPPTVDAGPDRTDVKEGQIISLAPATFNDKGTLDTHTTTIDWGDGTAVAAGAVTETPFGPPGSTSGVDGTVAASHAYGDNGTYTATVCVEDDDGAEDCDTFAVSVANVAPAVEAGPDHHISESEMVTLPPATFSDPGFDNAAPADASKATQENFTATIDWGDGAQAAPEQITLVETPGSEGAPTTGTVDAGHAYGDNGTFTTTVCVADDDDGQTCDSFTVTVDNVPPTMSLHTGDAIGFGNGDAYLSRIGVVRSHSADAADVGSDDLTFTWSYPHFVRGDAELGDSQTYFNDGSSPDPLPSSLGVFPFAALDDTSVTFATSGVYTTIVDGSDDDGATVQNHQPHLVTGDRTCTAGQGFWKHQFGPGRHQIDDATLLNYLGVVDFASLLFSEQVSLATLAEASDTFWARGPDQRARTNAHLLAAWLNFAGGGVLWGDGIDTDGDGAEDAPFHEVIGRAEELLLNPDASHDDLVRAKDLAEATNNHLSCDGNEAADGDTGGKTPSGEGEQSRNGAALSNPVAPAAAEEEPAHPPGLYLPLVSN